jgi:hypothetical protein
MDKKERGDGMTVHKTRLQWEWIIETKDESGNWQQDMIGENGFRSEQEAWDMVDDLETLGEEWADAEYRVVKVDHAGWNIEEQCWALDSVGSYLRPDGMVFPLPALGGADDDSDIHLLQYHATNCPCESMGVHLRDIEPDGDWMHNLSDADREIIKMVVLCGRREYFMSSNFQGIHIFCSDRNIHAAMHYGGTKCDWNEYS